MTNAFCKLQLNLAETERNIYQPAELFNQERLTPAEYINELISPYGTQGLVVSNGEIACVETNKRIPVSENVLNLKSSAMPIRS